MKCSRMILVLACAMSMATFSAYAQPEDENTEYINLVQTKKDILHKIKKAKAELKGVDNNVEAWIDEQAFGNNPQNTDSLFSLINEGINASVAKFSELTDLKAELKKVEQQLKQLTEEEYTEKD